MMKSKYVFINVIMLLLFAFSSLAQKENYSSIPSKYLAITYNKTTNLIFPFPVQSIDRGSKDILVQQPKGTQNIIQIKAGKPNFTQTNLSVITINGKLYSFTVDYSAQPSELNIIVGGHTMSTNDTGSKEPVMLSSGNNAAVFEAVAERIVEMKTVHRKQDKHNGMKLQLHGIYINHDVLYFRLQIRNNSNVSYDVDALRFSIRDRQKSKRTATQETDVQPLYTFGSVTNIPAKDSVLCIVALPKFTLTDSKFLTLQILEKDGGRNLTLSLKNRHIMHAIPVDEIKNY